MIARRNDLTLLVLGLATCGWAGITSVKSTAPVRPLVPDQPLIWYQPPHYYVWTLNASTAFGSEMADDVPLQWLDRSLILEGLIFYAGEWAGYWVNPAGFYLDLYNGCCPPAVTPAVRYYFAWDNPDMTRQLWYSSPGWFESWEVVQVFDRTYVPWCSSIGLQLDISWGTNPPYAGVATTDYYTVFGCGQAYWCFEYYGIGRWVTVGGYFGVSADMAYGLLGEQGSPTEPTTWGTVKSLYK